MNHKFYLYPISGKVSTESYAFEFIKIKRREEHVFNDNHSIDCVL